LATKVMMINIDRVSWETYNITTSIF